MKGNDWTLGIYFLTNFSQLVNFYKKKAAVILMGIALNLGEGNGTPLQYSCLVNPMGGGAWWAAVYGVAQSRTWLKWLSSSSIPFYGQIIFHCLDIPCFVYPFISWWASRFFHFLVTMSKDVMDIQAQLLMCTYVLILLRHTPMNRIAGPYSNPEMDHLRNGQTVFQSMKAVPLSISTSKVWGYHFLYILSNSCSYLTFWC